MTRLAALLREPRPLVMGILNVTPDSFSDAGRFLHLDQAMDHARHMIRNGADIIDVGGESTRPGAEPVSAAVELERVLPVVRALRGEFDLPISVDTSKVAVMEAVLEEDVDLINDVRALQDEGAPACLARAGTPVCLMHMQGEPRSMQDAPEYEDVVEEVATFFRNRIAACVEAGIELARILLDVGFGFGKSPEHNLALVNQLSRFQEFGLPLVVGLSRKSTIGKIVDDRLAGSIGGALAALQRGAKVLRVHDVAETVAAVQVWRSIEEECVLPSGHASKASKIRQARE